MGISSGDIIAQQGASSYIIILSDEQKAKVESLDSNIQVSPVDMSKLDGNSAKFFPHDTEHFPGWTADNYFRYIPKKE